MLVLTVSISAITQLGLVYVSFMQAVFQTEALSLGDLGMLVGLAGTSMGLHELRRRYERKAGAEENLDGFENV